MSRIVRTSLLFVFTFGTLSLFGDTTCTTPPGASGADGPVSAQANFTAGDGFITVTLSNTQANPRSEGQLLNGVAFTVSEGETAGTLGSNSANIRRVDRGGTFVDFGPASTGWALAQNVNGGLFLCVLCTDLGAVGPKHLLIGPAAGDGKYDAANGSIAGNKPHNPFTAGTATFLINAPGVTAGSTITSATFFFGTEQGSVAGSCSGGVIPI